jgi:hypothetical protein
MASEGRALESSRMQGPSCPLRELIACSQDYSEQFLRICDEKGGSLVQHGDGSHGDAHRTKYYQ